MDPFDDPRHRQHEQPCADDDDDELACVAEPVELARRLNKCADNFDIAARRGNVYWLSSRYANPRDLADAANREFGHESRVQPCEEEKKRT